jgi:glycerol-3-phosphate dehydrogenase (NAD(P)+)
MSFDRLGVIGGGAWGTALAQVGASGGGDVLLWAREPEVVEAVNSRHENSVFLAGSQLDRAVRATGELADLAECDAWLVVTPAQHMRAVLEAAPNADRPLILCSKGIEERSGALLHRVAAEASPGAPIAVLSGPTFAHEVAAGLPTAVTLAAEDQSLAEALRDRISRPTFRIYLSDDVAGAEIGGAVKNVLAIACGVVDGKGLGQNARAALIARGFAEMTRFGLANGAKRETLAGLSGLGDLVLTCSSTSSRNFSLGKGIGEGRSPAELMSDRKTVAEGAFTAPVLARLAAKMDIDMPVVAAVDKLLSGRANVDQVLQELLARPPRPEVH